MLLNFLIIVGLMSVVWLLSIAIRDVSIVDPCWGLGFAIVAWSSYLQTEPSSPRSILLVILTTIWAVRLAGYLAWRNWGHGEDRRYRTMREKHGSRFVWVSLFTVFGLQAILLWFIALPLQVAIGTTSVSTLRGLDVLGGLLWGVGMVFETIGDWQLSRFKANPDNSDKVMEHGLWRYTRHPNYFGDFCVWWGLYLIAVLGGAGWTILSPVLMSFLLLRVSGVTLLEKDISERRPAYKRYQQRTSAFFPWIPKRV